MYKFYFIKHHKMRNKFLEELKPAAFRKKKQASSFFFSQFALSLQTQKRGVMLEWLKRHAWKACIRQKRIASSNLAHSAKTVCCITARCFFIPAFSESPLAQTEKRETICCFPFAFTPVAAVTTQDSHLRLPSPTAPAALRRRDRSSGGT